MTILGYTEEQLRRQGALWTAREIAQQPHTWQATEAVLSRESPALDAFLSPLLAKPGLRIILTGAGSSAFIGQCLQPTLLHRLDRRVEAIATTDLVASPAQFLQRDVPTLLVSFGRSGSSPESVAAIDLAARQVRDCHQLVVTCNADGELLRRSARDPNGFALLLPDATHDRSFAMTSSFTSMLHAGLAAFVRDPEAGRRVGRIAAAADELLGDGLASVKKLATRDFRRAVYLGSGPLTGLAHEASLKLLELTDGAVVSLSNSPLGFRHGPKSFIDRETLVVVFVSNDPLARRYDLDLVRELRADALAGHVLALSAGTGEGVEAVERQLFPRMAGAGDEELCFPYVVWAQLYAFCRALELGKSPDNPSASGAVNRVVKGVVIHAA